MGWAGTKNLMWGDDPQDEVDQAINSYYLGLSYNVYLKFPAKARKKALATLKGDEGLREKVDLTYQEEWGRNANDKEFENLLLVGLGLGGGRTVYWGQKAAPRAKAKKKTAHTGIRGLG